jgi:hypothetical protein
VRLEHDPGDRLNQLATASSLPRAARWAIDQEQVWTKLVDRIALDSAPMPTVNIHEAKTHFSRLVEQAPTGKRSSSRRRASRSRASCRAHGILARHDRTEYPPSVYPVRAQRTPCSIIGSMPARTSEDLLAPLLPSICNQRWYLVLRRSRLPPFPRIPSGLACCWSPSAAIASNVSLRRPKKSFASLREKALRPRNGLSWMRSTGAGLIAPARIAWMNGSGTACVGDQLTA